MRPLRRPKPSEGPPCACVPLQRHPSQPRTVPPTRGSARRTVLPFLGFGALRHTLGIPARADRGSTRDPPVACEVWLPPARPLRDPYRRAKRRSVHGLPPTGRSPRERRRLLSELLPSWRYRRPRRTVRCTRTRGQLQGLLLVTGSFGRRSLAGPAVDALLGFSPPEHSLPPSGRSALVARPPLAPRSEANVPAWQGLRVLRSGRIGWSVSGLPALMGFVTS